MNDPRVLVGLDTADDAGILKIDDSMALVTTVDLLAPIADDPYEYGYIAATNCLSDIYAMGGDPLVCLNVVGWTMSKPPEILGEILKGSQAAVMESGALVLGGHTFQDSEIRFGLAVTGRIDPGRIFTNAASRPGDDLILTKPLGTGTVIACAISRGAAPGEAGEAAMASMKTSNASASAAMRELGAHACTDITGFGFLGHAYEMAAGSGVGFELRASHLPAFPSVRDLIAQGIVDGSYKMNRNSFADGVRFEGANPVEEKLLFASETSGGLLLSVDPRATEAMLARLRGAGLESACVVGSAVAGHPGVVVVVP